MKKSTSTKLWNDPVWSKVIAAAIIFTVGAVWSYLQGWWPTIGRGVARGISWGLARTPISNWLLAILSICTLSLIGLGAVILWASIFPESPGAGWQSYTTDEFFGIWWRWRYGSDGGIYELHSFCPACDYQVYAANASFFQVDRIGYRCEDCGCVLGEFDMSRQEMENRTIRAIQKKLRTNTWPKKEAGLTRP